MTSDDLLITGTIILTVTYAVIFMGYNLIKEIKEHKNGGCKCENRNQISQRIKGFFVVRRRSVMILKL